MHFRYGFEYLEVRYGWNKKQLYRLPFTRNNRSFDLKLINEIVIGSTTVYNIQRKKFTINKIKSITTNVDWNVEIIEKQICPF